MPGICGFFSVVPESNSPAIMSNVLTMLRPVDCRIVSERVTKHGCFGLGRAPCGLHRRLLNLLFRLTDVTSRSWTASWMTWISIATISDCKAAAFISTTKPRSCWHVMQQKEWKDQRISAAGLQQRVDLDEHSITLFNNESNTQPIYYAHTPSIFPLPRVFRAYWQMQQALGKRIRTGGRLKGMHLAAKLIPCFPELHSCSMPKGIK